MSSTISGRAQPMPWLNYEAPPKRNINFLVRGGLSRGKLLRERQTRARILLASDKPEHQSLGRILKLEPEFSVASTAACPLHARKWQEYAASRMLKVFRGRGKVFMVTLGVAARLKLNELAGFDVVKFGRRVRKQLQRKLMAGSIAFGVFEFSFDASSKTFLPHFHIFIVGTPKAFLERLRPLYSREQDEDMKNLMRIDEVTDLPRTFAYALKVNIYRRKDWIVGKRPPGRRLRVRYFREHMMYLHHHKLSDFVLCVGARLHSSRPSAEVLREEWLAIRGEARRRPRALLQLRS